MSDPIVFELTHKVEQGRPVVRLVESCAVEGVEIPAQFTTDFASIPSAVRWAIPVFGRSCRAAVLHDWLCHIGLNKAERSKLFLQQMLKDRVPRWQAWIQYLAVLWWPGSEQD